MKSWKALVLVLTILCGLLLGACGNENVSTETKGPVIDNENVDKSAKLGWGAEITFGSYEQDNQLDNGAEPIEWIVLDVQQDRALLLSKEILDAGYFYEGDEPAYWEESSLRKWLNDAFFKDAFGEKEQSMVKDTNEKVFLLSADEVENYFLLAWGDIGHFYDSRTEAKASAYAASKGLKTEDNGCAKWFLRSPSDWGGVYTRVSEKGHVSTGVFAQKNELLGIRPAIWMSTDASYEVTRQPAESREASLEDLFPEDWEGRYVLEEVDHGIVVHCKMVYDAGETNDSMLFTLYYLTNEWVLPESSTLGMYDGYPVESVVPYDIPTFSTDEMTAEYTDMIYEVGGILDAIRDRIAELEHFRQVDETGFDMSLYGVPGESFAGVYQLDCSSWSEESKTELLGEYNHTSYISISPNGDAYLSLGSKEPLKGAMLMAANPDALPEGEPDCIIWFEPDNIIKPVFFYQMTMTIHGMDDVEMSSDAPQGLEGSQWTYFWVDGNYWTEESMRGDVG